MPDLDDVNEAIIDSALAPKSVTVGSQNMGARDINELIAAANHVAGQEAITNRNCGFRFVQFVPGGAG